MVAIGPCTIFSNIVDLLLDDRACASATSSPWPTETAFNVNVGQRNGVVQAFTVEQIHHGKGLRAAGV